MAWRADGIALGITLALSLYGGHVEVRSHPSRRRQEAKSRNKGRVDPIVEDIVEWGGTQKLRCSVRKDSAGASAMAQDYSITTRLSYTRKLFL